MNTPRISNIQIRDVKFGRNIIVINPTNLYECEIGDDSFIGPFVEIQRGVKIGKRCRIQSHAFICELVSIGDDCFISHGAMFIMIFISSNIHFWIFCQLLGNFPPYKTLI